jgi:hypothetical protein
MNQVSAPGMCGQRRFPRHPDPSALKVLASQAHVPPTSRSSRRSGPGQSPSLSESAVSAAHNASPLPISHDGPMSTPDPPRSVKIGADERTGWSSERPRKDGAPPRPPDLSVRSRVLRPSDRLRYTPGSLLVILGPAAADPTKFAERVLEERGTLFSLASVRAMLAGRVAEEELEEKANQLLQATVLRRVQASQTVVLATDSLQPAERERYVRIAHAQRRPRHLILLEARRDDVLEDERGLLDELRKALDAGELGQEGFQTALRLSGDAISEVKRIVFQRPPRDD